MPVPAKLAVILHADVESSTALVQIDESVAHERIQAAFRRSASLIVRYGGTAHELRGDALVAEFLRASDAVSAGLAVQAANRDENASLGDEIRPRLRIGISLGEVIVADGTLTGPGVVLAQRIEQLADPDGVVVTEAVREAVPGRLPYDYLDRGSHLPKGFTEPVHAYTVRLRTGTAMPPPAEVGAATSARAGTPRFRALTLALLAFGFVIAGGIAMWLLQPWLFVPAKPGDAALPGRPSIAVLPFVNASQDAKQEYFADGLTDDLITDLAKLSGLFVVSRNSVFSFKNRAAPIEDVARDLGVRFVLEGNVRRADDRVRVNARLVDGRNGNHLWAERYDREVTDIFQVQDELVTEIALALAVQLSPHEEVQVRRAPTGNLEAYEHFVKARELYFNGELPELRTGVEHFQRAIVLDPDFAEAHAGLASIAADVWRFNHVIVMNTVFARNLAEKSATRALALDPAQPQAHSVLALLRMVDGQHEFAQQLAQRATELSPNSADAHATRADVLGYGGHPERALDAIRTAVRLNPLPPISMQRLYGWVLFLNREYDEAIALLKPIAQDSDPPHGDSPGETLVMALAQAGREEEARARMQRLMKNLPFVNLSYYRFVYSHHARAEDLEHRIEALRLAGVPELALGFEVNASKRLSEDEVRALVRAERAWQGTDAARAEPFVQEFMAKSEVVYAAQSTLMSGSIAVKDGQLCERFAIIAFGREACGYVYLSTTGQNRYTYVNPVTLRHFEPVR